MNINNDLFCHICGRFITSINGCTLCRGETTKFKTFWFVSVSKERGPAPTNPPPGTWRQHGVDTDGDPVIIAEAENEDQIIDCWPEAVDIRECDVETFTIGDLQQ